ncbi:UNVERIFIED_CONTAM: hypothetical protein Slati_2931800 [Sesamum latifolium]|uniref:Uncharacterized protein n=1 Tax=Sesamum latifolium TaxID=2727402 RepID=A0AAW2VD91_9LAMI
MLLTGGVQGISTLISEVSLQGLLYRVLDQTFWPLGVDVTHTTLLPTVIKRMPGRPKKSRRKEPDEAPNAVKKSSIVRCKACNELGHNRRTCLSIQVRNSGRDSDIMFLYHS